MYKNEMIVKLADNIFSPLGVTTAENFQAVMAGRSALTLHREAVSSFDYSVGTVRRELPEPFMASLFLPGEVGRRFAAAFPASQGHFTRFEQMAILSASAALTDAKVDPRSPRVLFILSSTKGNVALLERSLSGVFPDGRVALGASAAVIARFFGNPNPPLVVSNACISGVCAQIAARRALQSGRCDVAVVIGADEQSEFIVSGFQSFKALSPEACRPFDAGRVGLNLGEAAATIVLGRKGEAEAVSGDWAIVSGAIRNDANHISGPSRVGEGSFRALRAVLHRVDDACAASAGTTCRQGALSGISAGMNEDISGASLEEAVATLAFINVHGTATPYNDEMESIAIDRAGLAPVPVNGLKGYYGHTMGAAGVLETCLSMLAVDHHVIIGTRGYERCGVSRPLCLDAHHRPTGRRSFIKLLSGFGGCNAALLCRKL